MSGDNVVSTETFSVASIQHVQSWRYRRDWTSLFLPFLSLKVTKWARPRSPP